MNKTVLVLVETLHDDLPILENQGYQLVLANTPLDRAAAIQRECTGALL